jgi:hypothetical protein
MTGLAAVVAGVRAIAHSRRRRAALAARAEWEHAAMQARPVPPPPPQGGPWHVMTHWPTTPMNTAQIRARR